MRFAYLVMAHDGFGQLAALLRRLLLGNQDLAFVHVDRRVAVPAGLTDGLEGRAQLIERRVACRWGHWRQLDAELALLDAALPEKPDFLHLLSGRDWPLLPREAVASEIARDGRCRIDVDDHAMQERMDLFALDVGPVRERLNPDQLWRVRQLSGWANAALSRLGVRRSRPFGPWARGSQWWSLPYEAARHVAGETRRLIASGRLRFTSCPDEHVVQTILLASRFGDAIGPNRRLIRWEPGAPSPAILTAADLEAAGTNFWFGRKFVAEVDPFFLEL